MAGIEQMNGNIKASPGFAFKIPQGICWHLLSLLFIFLTGFQQPGIAADQTSSHSVELTQEEKQFLSAHPVIRLAPDPDFPPFEWFSEQGQYSGIVSDYVTILENALPVKFEIIRLASWDACLQQAQQGQVDVFAAAADTPQRRGTRHGCHQPARNQ